MREAPTSATGVATREATTADSGGVAIEAATGDVARGVAPTASIAAARDSVDGSGSARGNVVVDIQMAINEDNPVLYYTPAPEFSVNEEFNPLLVAAARDSADGSGSARDHAVLDIDMAINEESPLLYYTDDHDFSVGEEFDPLEMV
ncbi:hypothetical protein V6N13_039441 [Hibiscus sabdariffa]